MKLSVAILHAYRDPENPSMRQYADRLGHELERRGLRTEHVAPPAVLPTGWRQSSVLSRIDGLWGRYVRYPALARRVEADVIHVVDHSHAHLVGVLPRSRTVVTCHDVILLALAAGRIETERRFPLATLLFRRDVAHLREAAAVVVDSERTRRDLVDLVGVRQEAVEVIPPGLAPPTSKTAGDREATRRRVGLVRPTILHVGHSGFYKNLEGCLQVLSLVRRGGIDARFVHAGKPLQHSQRALAERLGVMGSVDDRGHVPPDVLAALYEAADVLLFPSLYEGFGWPPLEAMASGLPVVCSGAGSLPEVTGDAALVAGPHDHAALAGQVASVLTDPGVAESLRRRGRVRAGAFTWVETARRMELLYRRITDGR